ncbi:hypothetical protein K457DRAFT_14867 [Linnemannia elongata AG-77]|uniref:Uncharacterized protein n=1 Tax=Linnemannia elongata AG-77 TaxID=1314771 RepID=A0A197K8Z0_9FUNG|nr:hypothetical protein K457DRAFT_14867 [Linnemannia elongata AG-77]
MGNVSSKHLPDNNTFPSSSFSTTPAAGVPRSTVPADSSASLSSSTADSPSKDTEKTTTVAKAHRSSVSFSPSTFSSPPSTSIVPPSTRLVPPPILQFTFQPNNDSDNKDGNQTRSNNDIHIHSENDNDLASVVKSPHSIEPTTSPTSSSNTSSNTSMPSPTPASLLDKPLPASPASASASLLLSPSAFPDQETVKPRRSNSLNAHQHPGLSSPDSRIGGRVNSLSQQSMHSQSSLSGRSIASNSSGSSSGHGSGSSGSGSATRSHNSSANTVTTRTTSISGGPTESVGQLSLQRFPTGESEYKVRPPSGSSSSTGQGLGGQTKASRTTSMVSSSSARSSSGSSGFKFSFKPLLSNHGNDSKQQQQLYRHHNGSSPATSPNGHQAFDPFANSPFPAILISIKLPQSLLDKYIIDQESFRHGKGIWGIGKYSWTITVLSRANGKKYVIKRVSKSLLPPSAYYHYPTTAHRLCTCPACKSLREQLLLTGQLPDNELENLQEVLVIHNKGRRKELPQLPPSSPQQQSRQLQPQRPLSASSIASPTSSSNHAKESKEKQRRSFNLYSCHNASTPNHTSKFSAFSPITTPQDTPVNSRPSTPIPSPLRMLSTPPPPSTLTSSSPLPVLPVSHGKIHNSNSSINNKSQTAQSSLTPTPSPLLPAETPLSWSQKTGDSMVSQGRPRDHSRHNQQQQDALRSPGFPPRSAGTPTSSQRTRPNLQRHASTPNMSHTITGLDVLETDPARVDQLRQLSRLGNHGGGNGGGGVISFGRDRRDTDSRLATLKGDRPPSDSPLSMTMTMQALYESTLGNGANGHHQDDNNDDGREVNVEYEKTPTTTGTHSALRLQTSIVTKEMKVSPFDTNDGEFKQMEPESPESSTARARNGATSAPLMFTPPPHALPMELVLLQTYNDSDHLPEHHEWTQDEDYWYYVTKAHGVRRRKLKKVSSWWLDLSSLGGALLSAGSSSSQEPIATGPIYNMGRAPGTISTTPHPSSPLSSELALASPSLTATDTTRRTHAAKESISSMASQETVNPNSAAFKRQSSPRNSTSLMGKYYYVDWDEYLSL